MSVAVIYFSESGNTHQVAGAISDGVLQQGVECQLLRVTGDQIVNGRFIAEDYFSEIDQCSAVVFGSPTYMGGPAAQFKAFCDASSDLWENQLWSGKLAAGFTVGSNPGGDQLATLQYFSILAAQHGMLWVNQELPDDKACNDKAGLYAQLGYAGVVAGSGISQADKVTAARLGSRVALLARTIHEIDGISLDL